MTMIYFSGENSPIEKFICERPEEFSGAGVLLSYWSLRNGEDRVSHRRMHSIIEGNVKCKATEKK